MLWVLKRTISMGPFNLAPKTYVKTDGLENIHRFMLKKVCLAGRMLITVFNEYGLSTINMTLCLGEILCMH